MKIKADFVTNSSSTCYVMGIKKEELNKFNDFLSSFDSGVGVMNTIETTKDIKTSHFGGGHEYFEDECKDVINDGGIVFEIEVSDELGYGLMECTKFSNSIILSEGP